jgi:XTP/dITP diphosphohydrolase
VATIEVNYVTSSQYKREEATVFLQTAELRDGTRAAESFDIAVLSLSIKEHLEIDITTMVMAEVANAYSQLKIPCIVEHAGLVFDKFRDVGYPGGLTKPMWNTLGVDFVAETNSAGARAVARSCVAYCDGQRVETFIGETQGRIASEPKGSRHFYWDTIFIPDDPDHPDSERTYAEIVEEDGLAAKMHLSQSGKALRAFLEYRLQHQPELWPA